MNRDKTCLADGYVFDTDQEITGINENEIVVGPTRSGKTMSVVEPRLLHTYDSSVIVTLTKRTLVEKYAKLFEKRGYEVWDLNLSDPAQSNIAYDPMDFVENERDALKLASFIVGGQLSRSHEGEADPYWNQSGISCIAAIIDLALMKAKDEGRKATFADFYKLYSLMEIKYGSISTYTSLDIYFDKAEKAHPDNQACRLWRTIRGNAPKTAACIYSVINNAVDKLMVPEVLEMMKGKRRVSFKELADKKVIIFLTTSPVNKSMQKLASLFYADAFGTLFEYAESLKDKVLPRKVHIICDDFATGSCIPDFHEYLSVFCAKKISVTLLLQSESQLECMYGKMEATTIINNCDTYLYLGGMDDTTCYNISRRRNIPVEDVYAMPLEEVMLFRRGARPVTALRYQTLKDPVYKELDKIKDPDINDLDMAG